MRGYRFRRLVDRFGRCQRVESAHDVDDRAFGSYRIRRGTPISCRGLAPVNAGAFRRGGYRFVDAFVCGQGRGVQHKGYVAGHHFHSARRGSVNCADVNLTDVNRAGDDLHPARHPHRKRAGKPDEHISHEHISHGHIVQ